jgi:hypothetical protein
VIAGNIADDQQVVVMVASVVEQYVAEKRQSAQKRQKEANGEKEQEVDGR